MDIENGNIFNNNGEVYIELSFATSFTREDELMDNIYHKSLFSDSRTYQNGTIDILIEFLYYLNP